MMPESPAWILSFPRQSPQPSQVFLRTRPVAVMRQHPAGAQGEGFCDRVLCQTRVRVEEKGRAVTERAVARKKIPAKEQTEGFAPVAGVAGGVAGEMDRPQSVPDGEFVAVGDPSVRGEGLESQQPPPRGFHHADDPVPSAVAGPSGIVIAILSRCRDPGSVFPREGGGVGDVVEVPVGQEDPPDREVVPPPGGEGAVECSSGSKKSGVDESQRVLVAKDVKRDTEGRHPQPVFVGSLRFHTEIYHRGAPIPIIPSAGRCFPAFPSGKWHQY